MRYIPYIPNPEGFYDPIVGPVIDLYRSIPFKETLMSNEQIEHMIQIELARIRDSAIKLTTLADEMQKGGGNAQEIADILVQAANVGSLYVQTALAVLHAQEDEDDECDGCHHCGEDGECGLDQDFDPCADAEGDCDHCENRDACHDDQGFDCKEDCSCCAEHAPCLESDGHGPKVLKIVPKEPEEPSGDQN
jgi:hypothetical protein